ncbi:MAG: D-alanine--poly(phosphoribitol) ligase subunit DltC [Coriobacteriales bacterium]|jgi:D-alanine--poly(phosphoribitol) ligase subunit 2|nr:D-alanine--poly(phosphoribitol) ligase subunit DltC [Coriobacteriales bacterium]
MDGLEVARTVIEVLIDITDEPAIADERELDLFAAGLLDSLGAIELLVAIEDAFDVQIAPTAVEREDMNTVNKIVALVESLVA